MGKPADLDWNDLRYFLAAARAGSLAAAARALGVEHSTIGRRLTALEEALGAALLTRGPDGLTLTAIGAQVVPLLEHMDRSVEALRDVVKSQNARVRVATMSTLGRVIAPHLPAFHAAHPEITLEIISGSRPADLKRGEADIAVRMVVTDDEDLISRPVGQSGWSLYASDAYLSRHPAPSDPRHLAGHDLLAYDPALAGVPGAQWIEQHGHGATIVMRCREVVDVLSACAAGLGLAVLPCLAAATEPTLRRLTAEVLGTRKLSLVYRKESRLSAPVKAVIDFLTDVLKQNRTLMSGES